MKGYFAALAFTMLAHNVMADSECTPSLEMQKTDKRSNYQSDLAFLKLVTKKNYYEAKKSASASVVDLFSGDIDTFEVKRDEFFEKHKYKLSVSESAEIYRSYLSESQLRAWTDCMRRIEQPIVRYTRNENDTITGVQIEWNPREALGKMLVDQPFVLSNSTTNPDMANIKFIDGTKDIAVTPLDQFKSVSGTLNGHTGSDFWLLRLLGFANYRDRSAFIYIPGKPNLSGGVADDDIRPKKIVFPIEPGTVYVSWAYWSGFTWPAISPDKNNPIRQDFPCLPVPPNTTYVQVQELRPVYLGRRQKGKCVPRVSEYCDDRAGAEGCVELVVTKSCLVNTEWYEWYKWAAEKSKTPFTNEGLCQLPTS